VQILHSHRYKENLLAALLARRCDVPVVVRTEHGAPEPFKGLHQIRHLFMRQLDRMVATYATDAVISVSDELKQRLTAFVDQKKITVIPNGLDLSSVSSTLTPAEAKARLSLPGGCRVIGYAGRLVPVKRLDIFLAAAEEIAGQAPESRFLVAGEGSEEIRLRQIVGARGLESRVLFLGHRDDIYDVLRALDVFLFCSDHEGLPIVLLEALHLGVPVVARRVGGIPEVVQHGVSGLLVDAADPQRLAHASLRILNDRELNASIVEGGRKRVAEVFSAERTADRVADLYLGMSRAERQGCGEPATGSGLRTGRTRVSGGSGARL
jgi:glycosyltransferase involved in cell wall biosynthesis